MNNCTGAQHAYASTTIAHPPSFKGTEVILNVWEPLVEPHCFSLAQLWLINTGLAFPYNSSDGLLNTIEAGWQVLYEIISEIFNYFLQNFVQYCLQSASAGGVWIFPPPSQFQQVARSLRMMHLPAPKSCIFVNFRTQFVEFGKLSNFVNHPKNLEHNCGVLQIQHVCVKHLILEHPKRGV